jgi:ABC-2 type transport system ATP-binding protein
VNKRVKENEALANPALAIETKGLFKSFAKQTAVNGIDLSVPKGSVFGFLGPNGSGKTTTIRLLLGLTSPSEGVVNVLGQSMPANLQSVLPKVGALVEGPGFYPFLSGEANLKRLDTADRLADPKTRNERVAKALERVGLTVAAKKKVHAYSLGMKQRLGIANALLQPRDLLILDEPTNGLDPQGTREVRNLIKSLASEGTTIFVSSHLLAEVEQLCTHVAVMSAGNLVSQGELAELRHMGQSRVSVTTPDVDEALALMTNLGLIPVVHEIAHSDSSLIAPVSSAFEPEVLAAALVAAGVRIRGFAVEEPSLEERFVSLTGEGFDVFQ